MNLKKELLWSLWVATLNPNLAQGCSGSKVLPRRGFVDPGTPKSDPGLPNRDVGFNMFIAV